MCVAPTAQDDDLGGEDEIAFLLFRNGILSERLFSVVLGPEPGEN